MYGKQMYTGTMIEDLIAAVERAEMNAHYDSSEFSEAEQLQVPLALLLEQSYGEQLVEVS